ncbi:MAG: hypothetical protein ABSC01_01885 [Verrucomicrobiota bacterium]|jgi:hypothetical protein
MKPFVIPIILWSYILSATFAKGFWGAVYGKLVTALDLSPNQGWILPIGFNVLVACIGVPQVVTFITSLRRREAIPVSRHIASALCIGAMCLSLAASFLYAVRTHQQLEAAATELMGGSEQDVFAAGEIVHGFYSNKLVGVGMELPKDWHPMTLNFTRRAKLSGAYTVAGNDEQWAEELAVTPPGTYALLDIRRYPNTYTGFNPSLVVRAYDKQMVAASGINTLEVYANGFAAVREPYHVLSGPMRKRFGTELGYYVQVECRSPGATIQQHVYVTETDTLYVVLVASAIEEIDSATMQSAIATLRVNKKTPGP